MTEIKKVLIANRGEIACRIISTLKKLEKKSVAIYSDFDVNATHVQMADEAICIGGAALRDSYNNLEAVFSAVMQSGADAVHPGYGFMAENPEFVALMEKEGVTFIGPSSECIRNMGDKVLAKKTAHSANVNLVPGFIGDIESIKHAKKIALELGFPVLIKAAAGGGGKGMRIVHSINDLEQAIHSAESEALHSFKDKRVFIEKYIQKPRHIEIQILADKHGNVLCLGERECSIQRRHQKVIEEAPSPFVDQKLRKKMYDQSVMLAKSVGYYSAGTMEYIVDQDKNFYFMEMNTRIQVEHPVTELITGVDIVEEMINIAEGKKLKKSKVTFDGWAFEARVYAEDPTNNFFPTTGFVTKCHFPDEARIESSVKEGIEVGMFYDPMIAKICVHDKTREDAIEKMQLALEQTTIAGVVNNLCFLQSIFYNNDFLQGNIDTNFIKNHYPDGFGYSTINNDYLYNILGTCLFRYFLANEASNADLVADVNNHEYSVKAGFEKGKLEFGLGNKKFKLESDCALNDVLFAGKLNNNKFHARIFTKGEVENVVEYKGAIAKCIILPNEVYKLHKIVKSNSSKQLHSDRVLSPITGMVLNIYVRPGDEVKKGDPLFVIEAMKMQNTFSAERSGKIKKIHIETRSNINEGDLILEFESA